MRFLARVPSRVCYQQIVRFKWPTRATAGLPSTNKGLLPIPKALAKFQSRQTPQNIFHHIAQRFQTIEHDNEQWVKTWLLDSIFPAKTTGKIASTFESRNKKSEEKRLHRTRLWPICPCIVLRNSRSLWKKCTTLQIFFLMRAKCYGRQSRERTGYHTAGLPCMRGLISKSLRFFCLVLV